MRKKKEPQVYDNTLKALFGDEAAEIIPNLLPGVELIGENNIEIDRSKLKADLVYNVLDNGEERTLNIELQTTYKEDLPVRLLFYNLGLLVKHKKPVISMVIYPFETNVPEHPFESRGDAQTHVYFSYHVFRAWKKDARDYVRKGAVVMYTFLPAMRNASVPLLKRALAQMQQRYPDRQVFEHHLLRFVKMLERSKTMKEPEKKEIREVLSVQYQYDYFIDENPDVIQRVNKGKQEGKQEGLLEGEQKGKIEALQQMVLDAVQASFPALMEMAKERVAFLKQPEALRQLTIQVLKASDEEAVRKLFQVLGH